MGRLHYRRQVLVELSKRLPREVRDEMAIPSYLHSNPFVSWLITRRMRCAIKSLELDRKQAILDFGCGTGMLFLNLPPHQGSYCGVDLVTWPAKQVLEAHDRNDVRLLNMNNWDQLIDSNSLDRIAALEVLEHVEDVVELAKLFQTKLKPDGRLIISGPTENLFYRACRRLAGFSGKYHRRDVYEIMEDLESVGFVREAEKKLPLPGPFALFVVLSYRSPNNC
ncbi:class I SAM-dependent methyltransferase [Acidobacteria bacterium AH-259-A15]|nr:class I SAM-dependent methyltransferase [Acidobacteria bacterium AH-259-A15]